VFCSADVALREAAVALKLAAAPHPAVAAWLAMARKPRFVRIQAGADILSRTEELVAYFVDRGPEYSVVWGIAPADTLATLMGPGVSLEVLRADLARMEPYMYRHGGKIGESAQQHLQGLEVLWSDGNAALVGMRASQSDLIEKLASRQHGVLQAPTPSMALLQPGVSSWTRARIPTTAKMRSAKREPNGPKATSGFAGPTSTGVQFDVTRYSGTSPIDAAGSIQSRHIRHPHASRAVQAIIADLQAAGYAPYTHTFSYGGATLSNVIADLPGTGAAFLPAQSMARLREALGTQRATSKLAGALNRELGQGWAGGNGLESLPPAQFIAEVERRLGLGGWIPWWRDEASTPGFGAEIVLVGCHLDSTAQGSAGFNPATSPAPGADDDASGVACTLAAARYFAELRGTLTHTVRFCFFNAEEQGLLGSSAYANYLKSTGAPLKAAIIVDMAGYDFHGGHSFEIHAGAADVAVRDASTQVAQTIARWAADVTALGPAQIYRGTSSAEQPDRNLYDPAIGRADHASFQHQGYPAVVVSEDFFINQAGEEAPEPNPNYHRFSDTSVNPVYVADIARAIIRAAEELAR
jgi:hypothetical protein